jgi:hypothetical protein
MRFRRAFKSRNIFFRTAAEINRQADFPLHDRVLARDLAEPLRAQLWGALLRLEVVNRCRDLCEEEHTVEAGLENRLLVRQWAERSETCGVRR